MEIIDLEMIRGDDESWAFEVTYEDESAVDFSGYRFDLHIKPMKKTNQLSNSPLKRVILLSRVI